MSKEKLDALAGVKRAFLGFQSDLDDADVVVVPVPYDSTSTYGSGSRFAPNAIIDASCQVETYDIELGFNICDKVAIHTLDELLINKSDPAKTVRNVRDAVSSIVALGKMPVVLGGEHSITPGAVEGLGRKVSVLQIDAHSDLRDSFDGTKNSHACAMRRVREKSDSVVQVGIRSMCEEEAEFIEKEGIGKSIFYSSDIIRNKKGTTINESDVAKIVSMLGDDVYVSVDVDGFDPSVIPGTGTPEPGGLLWEDVVAIMHEVGRKRKVVGFDIVEVIPTPPLRVSEFAAARLCYKMMGQFFAKK